MVFFRLYTSSLPLRLPTLSLMDVIFLTFGLTECHSAGSRSADEMNAD
jgi:hypothetical protein